MKIKPHSILRGATLLGDIDRIESDILKLRNGHFHGQIFDTVISDFAPASSLSFARTTDERVSEILRSGLIADLEAKKAVAQDEYDDLDLALLRPITIVQSQSEPIPTPTEQATEAA
jgi:hypothetical protein